VNTNFDQVLVEVNWSKFLRMENAAHTTLLCVSGSLWITRDNCTKDFEILPGDTYIANGRQSITVAGFEPSVVRVFRPQPRRLTRHFALDSAVHGTMSFITRVFAKLGALKHGR
jgi:hypothetical protein